MKLLRQQPTKPASAAPQPRARAGFSLLEVMCAVLILGVALVGLAEGMTTALRSSKDSELQAAASELAAGQIETLRASKTLTDGETEGSFGESMPQYRWKQSIVPSQISGLHEVSVIVLDTKTDKDIFELKTMLFDPDSASQDSKTDKAASKDNKKDQGQGRGAR